MSGAGTTSSASSASREGKCRGSETVTSGVRVKTEPVYQPAYSSPGEQRYVFGYRITVSNESDRRVRLLSRRWQIVDAEGQSHEVKGEGVVGLRPTIDPGAMFEYNSTCPLGTPWGTMEGSYYLEFWSPGAEAGAEAIGLMEVAIGRFYLVAQ